MSEIKARTCIKYVSAFCAIGFAICSSVFADTLATWVVPTSTAATGQTILGSTAFGGMITVNPINFTGTFANSTSGWGGSQFATASTLGAGLSKNFNFSITANTGNQIVVTEVANVQMTQASGGTGPDVYTVYYSLDNWANSTQIASVIGCKAVAKDLTTFINDYLKANSGANAITVKSSKTLAFRIVGTSAGSTGGTARLLKDATFTLIGTVSVAPVPNLVWGGAGTGAWDYDVNNLAWLDGSTSVVFSSGALATISSDSILAIAPTGVDAGAVTNSISSGTTTLTGGALTTGTLIKSGNGTLVFSNTLGVNNAITAVNLSGGTLVLQGGGTNRIGMPSLLMAEGSTLDLGDTDQNVTDLNGSGTVVMTNMGPSAADSTRIVPINDFKATPSTPSTFSGQITGTGSFRLGGGTLTLEGNNTYTGQTVMNGTGAILYIWGQSNIPAQTAFNSAQDGEQYATDLRFANTSTLAIKDVVGTPNNVVLDRSIGVTNSLVTPTFWGGSDPASSLELAGPIKTLGSINIANASSNSYGTVILSGANPSLTGVKIISYGKLKISGQRNLGGAIMTISGPGTFGLDDSAGPTNVVLTNSFSATTEGTFMAGTQTNGSSLTLAGPISGDANIVVTNSVTNAGTLILKGTNTFAGRLQVAARSRVYVVEQANIANQIYLSDTTGYGRFGLDASAADSVTLTNAILIGLTSSSTIGTFNPGTNSTTGVNRALHLQGVISGPGRVRVADGGDLCLDNSANTYTNLTRIGTGRILFGSDGALGGPSTDGSYGGIRFDTISDSYLVPTNNVTLNAGRTLLIQNNNTANLDSQGYTLTVPGSVQDEVAGEPGSVNKLGLGEVVLSGFLAYSGNTTVSEGKLTLEQINPSNESSTVSIVAGAFLNLAFSGSETVDKLYLNGVQSAAGTYDSTNSGGAITGAGSLLVTSSPPIVSNTAPVITALQLFSVAENVALTTVVGTVIATDADVISSLSGWAIVSGNTGSAFAINAATGQITVAGALNYEVTQSYSLGVTVSDGTETSAVGTVVVTVTNVSEYSDVFASSSPTADDNGDGISNLMAYALGATSPSSVVLPPALNTADPTKLTMNALIRIDDLKVSVVGIYGLAPGSWVTGSPITGVPSSSQTGAVAGVTQRQDFSVLRGTDSKKFMYLKATQAP